MTCKILRNIIEENFEDFGGRGGGGWLEIVLNFFFQEIRGKDIKIFWKNLGEN